LIWLKLNNNFPMFASRLCPYLKVYLLQNKIISQRSPYLCYVSGRFGDYEGSLPPILPFKLWYGLFYSAAVYLIPLRSFGFLWICELTFGRICDVKFGRIQPEFDRNGDSQFGKIQKNQFGKIQKIQFGKIQTIQ
jgi:hypothetical protein